MIGASAWLGASLSFVGAATSGALSHWVSHAGLGFLFVALSALALKERFCFRIPGLRLVPLLLALSLIPLLLDQGATSGQNEGGAGIVAAALLAPAAVVYGLLAIAKVRMPLHFDIGGPRTLWINCGDAPSTIDGQWVAPLGDDLETYIAELLDFLTGAFEASAEGADTRPPTPNARVNP